MDCAGWKELEEFLFARAMEHDVPKLLFRQACEWLSSSRVVRPGMVNVLERVAARRGRGDLVRDKPQPRQRAQLHRRPGTLPRPRNFRTNASSPG
jgi:hypothetical protein